MPATDMVQVGGGWDGRIDAEHEYALAKQRFVQGMVYECLCADGFTAGDCGTNIEKDR